MLPFALKVIWFCLSFTGTIACWLVLLMFARVIGSYWGPVLYSVFATLLQGIFCLGMIYEMNPFRMPKAFCIAQTFIIYYSAWSLTGVCAAYTFATSSIVLWPSPMKHSVASTLAWKNKYYFPIVIFPLACLSVSLPVLLNVNAIEPTDDLHCDASHPEWGRFLGYAGFSMILTVPCLFISAAAAHRVLQLHRNTQRYRYSFKDSMGGFHPRSQLSNKEDLALERQVSPVLSPNKSRPASEELEVPGSTEPTYVEAGIQGTAVFNDPGVPSSSSGTFASSHKQSQTWEALGTIDEDDALDPQRQMGGMALPSMTGVVPPSRPNLAPAIWRLIMFQIAFFLIQCLAALSTIIDVARHVPKPTSFGSQHVALVLVGWGPAILFGYLRAVRRQLVFWKK